MKQDECMKAPESTERADQDADSAELLGSGHRKESTDHSIKAAHIPETDNSVLTACALTVNPHKGISWSKTIQVIYFEEPQVQSTYKLHHHFANRPRYQTRQTKDEPVDQHQEETDNKECESDKK